LRPAWRNPGKNSLPSHGLKLKETIMDGKTMEGGTVQSKLEVIIREEYGGIPHVRFSALIQFNGRFL